MKMRKLLFLGLLFVTGILHAQTDFRPGYIIKLSGDTLYGQIDYRSDLLMSKICKFKNQDKVINEYSPDDIIAYRFIDSKYFIAREIKGEKVFLEYLIKGKVNIYYARDDQGDHYYIDKEDVILTEIPYEEGIRYVDNKPRYYESKKHIGFLSYYMQDAPELQSRIQSIRKPEHQILINIAEDYHNSVCEGAECIIYEKNTPFLRIVPEILGGIVNYSNVEDLNDVFYFNTGINIHVWMPRINEKLYFRTGLIYSRLEFDTKKTNYYKIPLHLEYVYPKGIFGPRFSYGLNYYYPKKQSVSLNIGANIELTEILFLSITSDIEFEQSMLILPKDFFAYSVNLGLFVKFK